MLSDHKHELGYRLVDKIVVFGDKRLSLLAPSESRSMAVILCTARPTPVPSPTEDKYASKKQKLEDGTGRTTY